MKSFQKIIFILFGVLFVTVPLILWPYNSELFEFNKMVVVYLMTTLIASTWIMRMISERRFIFRRTILDIPLLVFAASQLISTFLSIDPQTSWLGYYSRFNGGMFSVISYLILYWAFVSNIDKKNTLKLINITLWSAVLVSVYGVLERLGIDKSIWQQDVQHRVFSTLGQPNWLAAWLVALVPISWVLIIKESGAKFTTKSAIPHFFSLLFFTVLLFTGSRSGLLGFAVAEVVFWGIIFLKHKLKYLKEFLTINLAIAAVALIFGTQLTPSVFKLVEKTKPTPSATPAQTGATALETGGTESGAIRNIVWQGAIDIWKHYPIFGTGVETFAYSYYMFRPAAHNLTSEWDFIYNKAHNEYLNFMANSGTVGILSYLTVVGFAAYLITKNLLKKDEDGDPLPPLMSVAFASGYASILVTNFFGFSVVPVQILFYLYPAFSILLAEDEPGEKESKIYLSSNQKILNWATAIAGVVLLFIICRYWYADTLYAAGINYRRSGRQDIAIPYLTKAIKYEPNQSVYYSEIAQDYVSLALAYTEAKETSLAGQLTQAAIESSVKAVDLSPANVNLKRIEFGIYVMLSTINPNYLLNARDVLVNAVQQAPTDAKLYYNLGLIYSRTGRNDLALQTLKKTVELKPNYKDARLAYAILLIDNGQKTEAKSQLEYILANIDPSDSMSKQYLESIK